MKSKNLGQVKFTMHSGFPMALALLIMLMGVSVECNSIVRSNAASPPVPTWHGHSARDLHKEYYTIFKHGNRNAASHLWSAFLLARSPQMTAARFEELSTGYCAVSGSPVQVHRHTHGMDGYVHWVPSSTPSHTCGRLAIILDIFCDYLA